MIDPTGIFDNPKYAKLAFDNNKNFKNAEPFPHIHFDNFLSNDLALELSEGFPDYNELDSIKKIEEKSEVLHLGMDLQKFDKYKFS